jgi:hypothetical protein
MTAVHATTLVRMSLAQMSRASREIVRARCVANSARWDAGEIWTFTTFDVQETWRGTLRGRITIRLLGGKTDTLTSRVSGVPRFRSGEEAVLFLEPTARGDFSVVSWEQGTFRVRRDNSGTEIVAQDTASFQTFDPSTHQFTVSGIRGMPITDLRARINEALVGTTGANP